MWGWTSASWYVLPIGARSGIQAAALWANQRMKPASGHAIASLFEDIRAEMKFWCESQTQANPFNLWGRRWIGRFYDPRELKLLRLSAWNPSTLIAGRFRDRKSAVFSVSFHPLTNHCQLCVTTSSALATQLLHCYEWDHKAVAARDISKSLERALQIYLKLLSERWIRTRGFGSVKEVLWTSLQ